MDAIQVFHEAVKNPAGQALAAQSGRREIIGYLCSYIPEELIWAAGFHPLRLFSSKSEIVLAENHLQAYCCSLLRGVLEDSLAGRLDYLKGTVFPHTCDSMQRLSDIWRLQNKYSFFADVVLPVKLESENARNYMWEVLGRFREDLETASGRVVTEAQLNEAIVLFNRIRTSLEAIYAFRSEHPTSISGADLSALVRGSMIMDREQAAEALEGIAAALPLAPGPAAEASRVVISGSVCDSPQIYDIIESAGAVVVGDDLCTGRRWFEGRVEEDTADPLSALTRRYAQRVICPAKHSGLTTRQEHLASLVQKNRAQGVIFLLLKFCDPHAFDYPSLSSFLEERGIKSLLIELDEQQESLGQVATRIETFVHMLKEA